MLATSGSETPDLWRQDDDVQGEERVHAIGDLQTGRGNQSTGIGEKNCQRKNRVVLGDEGSYIENKASGRKVPVRVENGVCVMLVKDLIDTGGQFLCVGASDGVERGDTKNSAAKSRA